MARLQLIDPASATGPVKEILDGPLKGKHFNIFKGLANSESGLQAYLSLNKALENSAFSAKEKEAIALITGEKNSCDYCTAAHTAIGKGQGLSEEQTVKIRKAEPIGDDRIDAIVTFTARLIETRGFVDDQDIQQFKSAGFDDGAVVDLIVAYTLNVFTNTFNHVNDTQVDFPKVPELV
ncbi:MAG: carboxymuconolactone decarboxylase family protein [Phycisphaerales bacterium]|nr:carboxymuconolactone decarboxylase family protein [bacterium]